jgi:metal-responsive CopG/Arc/MetJ family transcriptional regulator
MLGKSKIKLEKDLLEKAEKYATSAGYSSVEELITHLLEKELAKWEASEGEKEVEKRLRGLGYID